jgi:PKD repeat protein
MKQIFTTLLIFTGLFSVAQDSKLNVTFNPQKVFIENNSQFNGRNDLASTDVLFATEDGPAQFLFSKNGMTYRLEKKERIELDEREAREEGMSHEELEEKEHAVVITTDVVQMQWKNSNPNVEVLALDPVFAGYNYKTAAGTIPARAFGKILYRNLYPLIDVEYVFHPAEGIEYNFILHPGADPSVIQMVYSDVPRVFLDVGKNIHLQTQFGDIVDHAPRTYYENSGNEIASKFVRKGNTVSFQLGHYDPSLQVILDPWTVTPAMGSSNKVFNIEADSLGNAYIYGGDSPYKLQKYDAAGGLQWTFTNGWDSSTHWCGTLIVDRAGNSYITAGSTAEITKVNTGGTQVWNSPGGIFDEYWSMAFNCDESELVVGGTRLTGLPLITGSGRAYNIDLNSGNVINSIKVSNAIPAFIFNDPNEIRSVCASPNGNYYFLTLDTIGSLAPALATINWEGQSGYRFGYGSPNYGFTPQGQSIIRATATHIYTANGDSVVMRDINTGAVVAGAAIPGGGHATTFLVPGTLPRNGGLVIDSCGNVYAGSQSNVTMYDANLTLLSSVPTPSAVYDVAIGANGDVLACGNGFAVAIAMSACPQIHLDCNTIVLPVASFSAPNTICPGTCTGFTNLSSNATSYQWYFPGASPATSTDTDPANICYNTPGTYDVSLTATSAAGMDSVTLTNYITVYAYPPPQGIVQGGDTLYANQGSNTYQWYQNGLLIPGATDYFYVISQNGNYNVVCTDSNSCEVEAVIFDVVADIFENNAAGASIDVFPNPVKENLEITLSDFDSREIAIEIFNSLGEKIYTANDVTTTSAGKFIVDSRNFAPGTYWLEAATDKMILRSKFIKQ